MKKTKWNARSKYWATSKDMIREIPTEINATGYWLEFNPNIGQWRLNHKRGVEKELMGYNPHKQVLIDKVLKNESNKAGKPA